MPAEANSATIAALRARIARIEGEGGPARAVLPFGIPQLDRRLPEGGLALGCLHEVAGGGNGALVGAAAACFAAGIAASPGARCSGAWCIRTFGQPTAAMTRWRVSLLPSSLPVPGLGREHWLVELIRAQAGESLDIELEA